MNQIERYASVISKLCERHKVKSLYAFGSVLTEKFNNESDIDLILILSLWMFLSMPITILI